MISEAKYLLQAINRRRLNTQLVIMIVIVGLLIGLLPMTRIKAEESAPITVTESTYIDGGGEAQDIDVYHSSYGDNRPGIIFVHGGGWRVGDKSQYEHLGRLAAARGYTAYAVNYRLGSAGTYYQFEDIMRAVESIKENASDFGTDPDRIGILGDSAGGSLAMRVAASGDTGLAAAVGWSAPVNAYTALFNSAQSFAIGLDHSTCIPTDLNALESIPATEGGDYEGDGTPASESALLEMLGQRSSSTSSSSSDDDTSSSSTQVTGVSELTDLAAGIASVATGGSNGSNLGQLAQTAADAAAHAANAPSNSNVGRTVRDAGTLASNLDHNSSTPSIYDPRSDTASEEVKAAAEQSPIAAFATHTADAPIPAAAQRAILGITDAFGCQDNLRVLSPSLNFASNTPPTFLVNAQDEFLVHPGQAIEYSNNLRAAGIESDYLILPGANHLGYDERAVEPTFDFLDKQLHP